MDICTLRRIPNSPLLGRLHLFWSTRNKAMCRRADYSHYIMQQTWGPLRPRQTTGPSTVLPFLGTELDTDTMDLRLPADKLHSLQSLIKSWQGKKSCTKRGLLSLIGHLQHVVKVVKPGRTFVRHMIDLATTAKELHHHICLNRGFQSDLLWWATFLKEWNAVGMLPTITHLPPNQSITSDASGTWGCVAF